MRLHSPQSLRSFPEGLKSIEKLAFNACSKLEAIILSEVTVAAADSFNGCRAVEELTINMVNPTEIFGGALPSGIRVVTLLNENEIAAGIFSGCSALEKVTLPFAGLTLPG